MEKESVDGWDDVFVAKIIDSLITAKKSLQVMPKLPEKIKPSHIRVLHAIYRNQKKNASVRVTDVSDNMGITKPSITKLINELIELDAVKKTESDKDKRVTYVKLTAFGEECVTKYVIDYHESLAYYFSGLDRERYISMMETVAFIYQSMEKAANQEEYR